MTAFDEAWAVVKADTGMWEEIYAPLLAQTTGMGELSSAHHFTDFVPTNFARRLIHPGLNDSFLNPHKLEEEDYIQALMENTGDHGWDVERLMQAILEDGFDPETFIGRTGRMDPSFKAGGMGIEAHEGRHRLLALDKLGAPHVPYAGIFGNHYVDTHEHPYLFGREFEAVRSPSAAYGMRNRRSGEASPWGIGGQLRGGKLMLPPSFMYGREMVTGMGRLLPVNDDGTPLNVMDEIQPINDKWQQRRKEGPSWKVFHDD